MRTRRDAVQAYVTKDGSIIRELLHPAVHPGVRNQSLAEATVPAGTRTHRHRHHATEELYHVLAGQGTMFLGQECFAVGPGDTVLIPPGTAHAIEAGARDVVILCCCAPAYGHEDTELLGEEDENVGGRETF